MYRAWITIDNRLYLWNYVSSQECEIYEGVSEIILSVSLSAPKPGMFVDSIKYVLVLGKKVCHLDYYLHLFAKLSTSMYGMTELLLLQVI